MFRRDPQTGLITRYATFEPTTNPFNPNPWTLSTRFDGIGNAHFNKTLQLDIPIPHVHDPTAPGGIHLPRVDELRRGY